LLLVCCHYDHFIFAANILVGRTKGGRKEGLVLQITEATALAVVF
jgi:hypothetical protein